MHRLLGITVIPNGFMIWSNYGGHADTDSYREQQKARTAGNAQVINYRDYKINSEYKKLQTSQQTINTGLLS